MNDFRVPILKSVINNLGWKIVEEDEEKKSLQLNNGFFIFLQEQQSITINIVCLELALIGNLLEPLVKTANEQSSHVRYEIQDDYLLAITSIPNSIFVYDDPEEELKNTLSGIQQEVKTVSEVFHLIRIKLTGM